MKIIPKSNDSIAYIGDELELFKNAVRWKNYFSKTLLAYIKGDVLEVGAGIGINTKYLAKNTASIDSWLLLEPDTTLANQINDYTKELNLKNKKIVNGTIKSLTNEKFDTIIYIDVLEHIEDSKGEIELAKQHLKQNGTLIILVPAYNFLFNSFDKKIGHFRRYNKSLLLNELNQLLRTEKLYYLDSVGFFASLTNKLFLKKELPTLKDINLWDNYLIPCSKLFDVISFNSFGKSLIGIFKNDINQERTE